MSAKFSEHTYYKRKYHDGLKIPCINCMLVLISNDGLKFTCKDLNCDDKYPKCDDKKISDYFSKKLSDQFHLYVYPNTIEQLWPVVQSVLKYVYYNDIIYSIKDTIKDGFDISSIDKTNWWEMLAKEFIFLRENHYNATKIPFPCVDCKNQ